MHSLKNGVLGTSTQDMAFELVVHRTLKTKKEENLVEPRFSLGYAGSSSFPLQTELPLQGASTLRTFFVEWLD